MFDPKQLLDQFLGGNQQGGNSPWDTRGNQAWGDQGQGWGDQRQGGGIMDRVSGYARENPMLTGGLAGGLAGLLLGRGIGGDLVKYGGMALIGGLAYKAYRDYQASKENGGNPQPSYARGPGGFAPPPPDSPFSPASMGPAQSRLAETLIVAMIAAAKADGHIDAEERGRIYQRLEEGGLQPEEVAFLQRELTEPVDIDRIVSAATSKPAAIEIYTASAMAVRADTPQERDYLNMLASRLKLEPDLVASIERAVSDAGVR